MDFCDRPLVYLAGPYAHPDPIVNTRDTITYADRLMAFGTVTVYVPHLTLLWHLVAPREPAHWYAYDLAVLARCDALLRLPGESVGADREVAFAHGADIPTFTSAAELGIWALQRNKERTTE